MDSPCSDTQVEAAEGSSPTRIAGPQQTNDCMTRKESSVSPPLTSAWPDFNKHSRSALSEKLLSLLRGLVRHHFWFGTDTLMRPSGGLWGARVPSCPFYTRPTERVGTLPAEAMGLIANTQLSASRTLPTALGPVENGHHHPAS